MKFFDTHAHYTDDRFCEEYEGGAPALLDYLFANGIERIVNIGITPENSLRVCEQAAKYPNMYAAVGIHPSDGVDINDTDLALEKITSLLERKEELKIVAIGEIGLDYYWDNDHHEKQKDFLHRQLKLAEEFDLPVIIHDREAHGDCFDAVIQYPSLKGVFHSYSGSAEMAQELIRRGWYISFSGVVSFKNAKKIKEVAKIVPRDRILIETDAPYLAPHPFRGKMNRSDYLLYTLLALAEIRNEDPEELAEAILHNSFAFFNKKI